MVTATAELRERSQTHKLSTSADGYSLVTPFAILPRYADDFLVDDVPTKLLQVDYTYARALTPSRIRELDTRTYDNKKAGVLLVSMRDNGDYFLIDGQGRMYLAINSQVPTLPCRIYIDLTVEQESELYLAFNRDRSSTTPVDDFKARLRANEPKAHDIQSVLDSLGIRVASGTYRQSDAVTAITSVEKVYTLWGKDALRYTLRMIQEIWPGEGKAMIGCVIAGLASFLARVPKLEAQSGSRLQHNELVARLQAKSPAQMKRAAAKQVEDRHGMSSEQAMGRAILDIYDYGRRSRKLGSWPERVDSDQEDAVAKRSARTKKASATRRINRAAKKAAAAAATEAS